ncbi:peptidoglycan D,D-transpeptidase FtsI family protein [Allostreptomyces psammosilenae]|uniref:Cell division protein FtsI/penicillin-binding protein 2 n=1 Tax=Allostreptomyces psammosilenae TaxID=1892865 RepID=A0A852ZUV6_9ACTN|nr:penicillin-binding protein 2 [Allostreptomyces psammosilenae]NYI05377.1 cell division protein FtsI/penicillin-binding protein 2 [Allostreptomyces psammosilenae]
MNKPLRHIAVFCMVLIGALLLRANWVGFVNASEYRDHPGNKRIDIARYSIPRGDIIVGGEPVTGAEETDDDLYLYKRTYTDGELYAPVTGYSSQVFGENMLEGVYDDFLSGDDERLFLDNALDVLTGEEQRGGSVRTTIDPAVQQAAFEAMGNKKGAAVALDPTTGAILGLVSTPSYDPNTIAGRATDTDGEAWAALNSDENEPMLNRALRETYPPGSTFKVVTAAAALENGLIDDINAETDSPFPWAPPTSTNELENIEGIPCENQTLKLSLRYSCNTVFGKIGSDLGVEEMTEQARKFGFNAEEDLTVPIRTEGSVFPDYADQAQTAIASIGQFDTRATPLQMAMVAAAVANDGVLMKPYLVDQLVAPDLSVIEQTRAEEYSEAMSPETAQKLQEMMVDVVENGGGRNAQIPGLTVGGKTGTAQHGENNESTPYAWFISYAENEAGEQVAVAVVVEDSDAARGDISGGGLAAPVAQAMMEAALQQ